jgi:hypothetical protein
MLTFKQIQGESLTAKFGMMRDEVSLAKIPGGWLVKMPGGLCFVPDPEHRWNGNSLP